MKMKSIHAPYSVQEILEALRILHPTDATLVMRRLCTNRLDAEERAAIAEMTALAEAMKGQTGEAWMVTQRQFDMAMRRADRAHRASEAYAADNAPGKKPW